MGRKTGAHREDCVLRNMSIIFVPEILSQHCVNIPIYIVCYLHYLIYINALSGYCGTCMCLIFCGVYERILVRGKHCHVYERIKELGNNFVEIYIPYV